MQTQGYKDHEESGKYVSPKEYSKIPVTGPPEMEIQELPDKEFKINVPKMFRELQENPEI